MSDTRAYRGVNMRILGRMQVKKASAEVEGGRHCRGQKEACLKSCLQDGALLELPFPSLEDSHRAVPRSEVRHPPSKGSK